MFNVKNVTPPPFPAQVGFIGDYADYNGGIADSIEAQQAPWAQESVEYVRVGWSDVQTGPDSFDTSVVEHALANLTARGKQAILRIYIHDMHVWETKQKRLKYNVSPS